MDVLEIIKMNINTPFGICRFSTVAEKLLDCRAKQRLPMSAASVICFAFPYKVKEKPPANISRYAAVSDYHKVCGKLLEELCELLAKAFPQNKFEPFVDNSPISEVFAAASAGLGVVGKNGLLITPEYGSFVFLGEIVTDKELPTTEGKAKKCSDCGACRSACPVGLCKEQCVSAVTQQKKPLSENEEQLVLKINSVWGCDICQNVCPLNKRAKQTPIAVFVDGYRDEYVFGESISGRAFEWRGEAPVRRNFLLSEKAANVIPADTTANDRKQNV